MKLFERFLLRRLILLFNIYVLLFGGCSTYLQSVDSYAPKTDIYEPIETKVEIYYSKEV